MRAPWPVGVIMATVVFIGMQIFLANSPEGVGGQVLTTPAKLVGWSLSGLLLLASLVSFIRQLIQSRRFKTTHSSAAIRSLGWRQFESFMGELFRQQGYFVVETPEGPDNGVDLVLRKDGEKTFVQCKHWKTDQVGVDKVRELLGSMRAGGAHNGIFVTSGSYTRPAKDLARECGIQLWDGVHVTQLLAHNASTALADALPISTEGEPIEPACPLCHAQMVQRVARRGKNAGNTFWGCSRYPACRGIRNTR